MNILSPRGCVALACGLAAALVLARALTRPQHARPPSTAGWTLTDFLEHLQRRGVRLHVVTDPRGGGPGRYAYLTEDADATWGSLEHNGKSVERIARWRG